MFRRIATAAAALTLTVPLAALPAAAGPPDGKGPGERPDTSSRSVEWYLALGDSLAAGFQPGVGDDLDGGYVGHVLDGLQEDYAKTKLVNLACSGETSATMIDGGRCSYDQGNQLDAAEQFLRAHKDKVSTVTIDIGANDVQQCVRGGTIDTACIAAGMQATMTNLPLILTTLDKAAHPDTEIVVGNYYNPFLAASLLGPEGRQLAQTSAVLQDQLNGIIAGAAWSVDAEVADVAYAFDSDVQTLVPFMGTTAPLNVVRICSWTWMCSWNPPDIHANDTGYAVMGQTFLAALAE
ncbi:SGNH/GDSL hydrolase family protein [Ornithinimicrobium kibberense]|uniref:SGNH/GDSL hydrolase family protein n=1 Tax=Ornithinimicrobium kibberense TaxID=282060 RepID=A0ABV5UZ70_9MICO|nr:SGNH/GDSL hydrolase family protein [Ornithinimicrobium kibberense]